MARRGHQGKVDVEHTAIVEALRRTGCSVQSLASIGHGCPDLLVATNHSYGHDLLLIEVKTGKKPLNDDQKDWIRHWRGPVHIVRSVEQALALVASVRGT